MRRFGVALAALLALLATSCSAFGEASTALSGSPSPSPLSSPRPTGPTPTMAPDGRPAIVVRTPVAGDELVSPVEVSGTANVLEGTVSITLLAGDGTPLASTTTTARCGSGCRGRWSVPVAFFVEDRVEGSIHVFEVSAEDGSAINVVVVPVTFVPGS